ncbi:thymidylate kinase isoform X3 [Eptesicus fuscus]|uniref:thymidylate kinase isoform X3 n=1 Tax=Eptesicus fuscus TaxID=29078 RepID=UPI002403DC7C|nr:thymidylate kinase isoform X3 [Eptesicus fuscus]
MMRESLIGCLLHAPYWGIKPATRHVLLTGIKPGTLQATGDPPSTEPNRPLIKEKLSQGITLIVDRYAFSGVAFTNAKENFSLHWCKQPDVGLPKPDLVVFLHLKLAEAVQRGGFGRERYEDGAFQERALQCYYQLMEDRTLNWKMIDASKSIEDVHKEICALSEDIIQTAAPRPLGKLWM